MVCVCVYVYMYAVGGGGGGVGAWSCLQWHITVSCMLSTQALLYRVCWMHVSYCMAGVFVTWSSFFLTQFTHYFLFWANLWFKALRSRWAPPPSSQSCTPRHLSPNPWQTVGHHPKCVGQYQGMCAFMAGWIHEPAQSLHPHLSCTYFITIWHSHRG